MRPAVLLGSLVVALALAAEPAVALNAGAGRSDLTPPTGLPTMGYVRSDAVARGQHTRLYARAIVLEQAGRKFALVTTDLGATPGGLTVGVARKLAARGFDEQSILISASHTHSGPGGFSSFTSDNFVPPTLGTPTSFSLETDRRLLGFLIERVAAAVERADTDLGPARAGWGSSSLHGVTQNRSLEALLANFGKDLAYGEGRVDMVPGGYPRTIDPRVDVLRVDRVRGRRIIPMGGWLSFANHGTVDPYTFGVYSGDHHGVAQRVFEARVRREGRVPPGEEVVGAYGNSDAGDVTAGLVRRGPAAADEVGRAEAKAMLVAWRRAASQMSRRPALDWRWTRLCFCGQSAGGGAVASEPSVGLPFLTGSEENRGPLFDVAPVNHEGMRLPAGLGAQGRKLQALGPPVARFATAVPIFALRIGNRLLASVPGEMTVEMGRRTREAVLAAAPSGVERTVIAGYANEYLHYFTTPEEYEKQHYEGGSNLYGTHSSELLRDALVTLTERLTRGEPAPEPHPFDATDGTEPDERPYERGAEQASVISEPAETRRLSRARFSWRGGRSGTDRPLDRPFVSIEREVAGKWVTAADDLGLELLWRVDEEGRYTAEWQVRTSVPTGRYRFSVTANRYGVRSAPFRVSTLRTLGLRLVGTARGRAIIALDYPPVDDATDLVSHAAVASGGRLRALVGGRVVRVVGKRGLLTLPLRGRRTFRILEARDRFGNRAKVPAEALTVR
ncbi:MAG: neutral/alkaline non-lysosomal ceramidase N-terminal domain-containing protein [Solirubrobacterales bacterium]|nr:neutral/alkaline non-lysosomal ceramidase N-terminal domain-containing protein [Solirubrobacterales bacterium]